MNAITHTLKVKRLDINTYKEAVIYIREDCHICRSEGFEAQTRIQVTHNSRSTIATLNIVGPNLLALDEASLSNYAWELLDLKEGDEIMLAHPKPLRSLSFVHAKVYGKKLAKQEMDCIVDDIISGRLSDIQIATFLSACASNRLDIAELTELTKAMIRVGDRLSWHEKLIVDKHSVGGLPGNRTSLIVVPIVAEFGLTIPKTSSRAITSPAGTADTMEVLAPVNLDIHTMRHVVGKENGCIVWGGAVALSPADDILIRIERAIDLDSEGQLVASVLSKKIAAGSTHVVIDMPVGPTAKVRSMEMANILKGYLESVGKNLGTTIQVIFTDGTQPVGRGIGPALEAKDVLAVLQGEKNAPQDLREHALLLAGQVLEFSNKVLPGTGKQIAQTILDSGRAWRKFQAICHAQGGLFEPPVAPFTHIVRAKKAGLVKAIDNRSLARVAKLAGAPRLKAAGVELLTPTGTAIQLDEPLYVVHSETPGELHYAIHYLEAAYDIILVQ